jgi:hypothetical protein
VRDDIGARGSGSLDVVDGNLLAGGGALALLLAIAVLVELEAAVAVFVGAEGIRLVDLGRVGQFAVGFPTWGVSDVGVKVVFRGG